MTKSRNKMKAAAVGAAVFMMAGTLVGSQIAPIFGSAKAGTQAVNAETPLVSELKDSVDTGRAEHFDSSVVQSLAETLGADREVSAVVKTTDSGLLEAYEAQSALSRYTTVADYAGSSKGSDVIDGIDRLNGEAKRLLQTSGVKFRYGAEYNVLMGGFEVVTQVGDFEKLAASLNGTGFEITLSEEYLPAESQLVENDVNVHDTGIFKNDSKYDGTGTVIAVLDTGLDYTHSAFDPENFDPAGAVMDTAYINQRVKDLRAAQYTNGLTAANVYLNPKVPYAYDYADRDTDVYPLENQHGTHVSGIIVGEDDVITGVAPNAQLASMKVFSDTTQGARWSWILAALEDCVVLDVDVINMSLGSSCGFTVETENGQAEVYESLAENGISLVAAASNDYNSTYGSEKNGNLGLTTNPDSATIGSPGSYTSALAVASISGVKTPYLLYNNEIMYFTESANAASEPRHFVEDLFASDNFKAAYGDVNEATVDYVTISGVGTNADYRSVDVKGKIALVRRGKTTFEEKARAAELNGALGVIIYNNVSGDITMTVGSVKIPVCSISQDNGELLAEQETGKIKVSLKQVAGPFMSNFSSWGPTPDLRLKPEITAHGGDIYSAVPGQRYDRLSGTSMASPNQAGVTALVRQYVKETFKDIADDPVAVMNRVNQIMMSTADIAKNTNGLPYSVRKQGAGLANLTKATTAPAFISTFARSDEAVINQSDDRFAEFVDGELQDTEVIDKAKIEYGDDKAKTGSYLLKFNINNVSQGSLTYDVSAIVMTEGISETKTYKGFETVTEEGYALDPEITVEGVVKGTRNGNEVTVSAGQTATVTVRIKLSDSDRQYLETLSGRETEDGYKLHTFENGMYVEGFVTLTPKGGSDISLNVPYLAFYGDWTEAPIFDLDYFETDKDAKDSSFDNEPLERTLPDAFATTPLGGLDADYISYLGSYYFVQDPSKPQITADRKYVSLTNQEGENGGINHIYAIYAGMLRGAKNVVMTITDSTTGEVIWTKTEQNQRKSYNAGAMIHPSTIDVDFHVSDYDLKNNTTYLFRAEAELDYPGEQNNKRNVFEFPFVTDFQAPVVTDAQFYTEYDSNLKKNRLYARLSVYDNHYTMCASFGQLKYAEPGGEFTYSLDSFERYFTQAFSEFNSTTEIEYELTDYIDRLSDSVNKNTFTVALYDYALNQGIYEIRIPDSVRYIYFNKMEGVAEDADYDVALSPNQTYQLDPVVYPVPVTDEEGEGALPFGKTSWGVTLLYKSSDETVAKVVDGQILAVGEGTATITATSASDESVTAALTVKVLGPQDAGYQYFDKPVVKDFLLTGFYADHAFYFASNSDRDIGLEGYTTLFNRNATSYALSMYPSEEITVKYELTSYADSANVVFESGNSSIATVDKNGKIKAIAEGQTTITVSVEGSALSNASIVITVKNPYEQNGPYLNSYRGGAGEDGIVEIPGDKGYTEIYQYAFSGYQYIPKDVSAGDEISEEDPSATKIWYYGENQDVKTVIIPEGIEVIGNYAFAGMEGLEEVYLPTTLNKIAAGAFYGCTNLKAVHGIENVQFINQMAFSGPATENEDGTVSYAAPKLTNVGVNDFKNIIAIGDKVFQGSGLKDINLPASAQSIGAYAFADSSLMTVRISAPKIKLGVSAFENCTYLTTISLNASVIPDGVFEGCVALNDVTLGKDVESIGVNAFADTKVETFTVRSGNAFFKQSGKQPYLVSADGTTLVYVVPVVAGNAFKLSEEDAKTVTTVGVGAFSGHASLRTAALPNVNKVGNYAFYDCPALTTITFKDGGLEEIGSYAFAGCGIRNVPAFAQGLTEIAPYAFFNSGVRTISIPAGMKVGEGAFFATTPTSVEIGDGAVLGTGSFQAFAQSGFYYLDSTRQYVYGRADSDSTLRTIKIGKDVEIGNYAFAYHTALTKVELGEGATIGEGAFYSCTTFTASRNTSTGRVSVSAGPALDIDLSGVKSVGAGAFAGEPVYMYELSEGALYLAGNIYYQTPRIQSVDLSAATSIGEMAFAYSRSLTKLTLGENIKEIGPLAFAQTAIAALDLKNVTNVGIGAFLGAPIATLDLSKVDTIGASAFAGNTALTGVTLKEGASVGAQAFYGDTALATVTNLDKAVEIGGGAFAGTALTGTLDISSAKSIGSLAFMQTGITSVKLSDQLFLDEGTYLGENPFADCPLGAFQTTAEETFHGQVVDSYLTDTFDLNENVKVIGGALYKKVPGGGLELVTYPAAMTGTEYTVAEGTVRIAANAFRHSGLSAVILPQTLRAIGDQAFFGCANLYMVTFKSMQAPILEEQYDEDYASVPLYDSATNQPRFTEDGKLASNLPSKLAYSIFRNGYEAASLDILKFPTLSFDPVNVFFGANFVNYIGHMKPYLIMVSPSNGVNYDSFVFSQYFGTRVAGAVAPSEVTLAAIEAIKALPAAANITLADEAQIYAARDLYNAIATAEQQALVQGAYDGTNYYSQLSNVIEMLEYIKGQQKPSDEPSEEKPEKPSKGCGGCGSSVAGFGSLGVVAAALLAVGAVCIIRRKKD